MLRFKIFFVLALISITGFSQNYFEQGIKYANVASYDTSIYFFNKALSQDIHDTLKAEILINRGKSYQLNQNYDLALTDFNNGIELFKEKANYNGLAYSYTALSEFNRHLAKFNAARANLNQARLIIDSHPTTTETKAYYHNRFAAILTESGGTVDSIRFNSFKAIEYSKITGNKNIEAASYNEIGHSYGQTDSMSIYYYRKALEIYENTNNYRAQVGVLQNIAIYYNGNEQPEECIKQCDKAIEIIGDKKWLLDLEQLNQLKEFNYVKLNNYKEAYKALQHYHINFITHADGTHSKNLKEVETKYEVEKKDNLIALQKEKSDLLEKEAKQNKKETKLYILLSVLLALILTISIYAYLKIKKTNQLLHKNINQKEILLQEVHHRVKNNLTVLNSLLYLRSKKSVNEETKLVLDECQTRIQSMALVHQNLYDVDDAEFVDLNKFISQLINESKQVFSLSHITIENRINTNNIQFDMSFTVFLGLILNELITNSFKYALVHDENNIINIDLVKENKNYTLTYSDSGKGLPKDFDLDKTEGFGFKLIRIMVNQIQGKLNYSEKNNTFILNFKKD